MFNTVSIIGCGLIGSSILRAIQKRNLAKKVKVFEGGSPLTGVLKSEFNQVFGSDDINKGQFLKRLDQILENNGF